MKKAEEYIKGLRFIEDEDDDNKSIEVIENIYCFTKADIIKTIKQAQVDAIDATVKKCAENARMSHKYYPKEGRGNYKNYCEFKGTYPERYDSYGESIGVDVFQINEKSILQVAEELKKELI